MRAGPKPKPPSMKTLAGTFQPCRDAGRVELIAPARIPIAPDWLTEGGREQWLDLSAITTELGTASAADSAALATLANLQGALAECWAGGFMPPTTALVEFRRLSEMFGIAGVKSRVVKTARPGAENPFEALRRGNRDD